MLCDVSFWSSVILTGIQTAYTLGVICFAPLDAGRIDAYNTDVRVLPQMSKSERWNKSRTSVRMPELRLQIGQKLLLYIRDMQFVLPVQAMYGMGMTQELLSYL